MAIGDFSGVSLARTRWRFHRALVERELWIRPFSRRTRRRMLAITCSGRIAQSQIHLLYYFREQLEASYGIELREVTLDSFERGAPKWQPEADIVIVQPWYDVAEDRLRALLELVHSRCRPSRVVFFDSFAPTDLRLAHVVDPYIDIYVKKHVLRDRSLYGRPTRGDTNLVDHFSRRYGCEYPEVVWPVSAGLLDKLIVGPSFATADFMLEAFEANRPRSRVPKDFDLHSRIETKGLDWYEGMRGEAQAAVDALADLRCLSGTGVPHARYLAELSRSVACLSPFGYGEVAWRDYESILCGALLLKPDCSHLEVEPDIFVPFETYVPIRWDYSDLGDKLRQYLDDASARERITATAFERLHSYFRDHQYLTQLRRVFE